MGSITIDQDWMDVAGLQDGQAVDVLNINNGNRLTTYAISGKRGLGEICLNGAAAHYFEPGHKVIIIAYCYFTLDEKKDFSPKVLLFHDPPPFKIDSHQKKVQWLDSPPTYSLLREEKPSTTDQESLVHFPRNDWVKLLPKSHKIGLNLLKKHTQLAVLLSEIKKENSGNNILDISEGYGFPALISSTKISQKDLKEDILFNSYKMILWGGNSLCYTASLSKKNIVDSKQAYLLIEKALRRCFDVLCPGGILLIDKLSFESSGVHVIPQEGEIEGKNCKIHWVFVNDRDSETQRWDQYNTIDQKTECTTLYSLLMTQKMLVSLLTQVGFISIVQHPLAEKDIYTVFMARKPKNT